VYEAQARGMYGKTIHEDRVAPAWLPKGTDVKVPGDWDRDTGGYTAALEADPYGYVTLLVASGRPIAEIHREVTARMFSIGAHGPLKGRVNGRVRDLTFSGGEVYDAATGQLVTGPVYYPTFDPEAGLNFTASTQEAPMGAEHWAMTFDHVGDEQPPPVRRTALPGALAGAFALSLADLHDEPEPALPTTDGADEDEEMDRAHAVLSAHLAAGDGGSPDKCMFDDNKPVIKADWYDSSGNRVVRTNYYCDQHRDAARNWRGGTVRIQSVGAKDPHAWLLEGAKADDVAGYAKDFLAKVGLKDFSAAERKGIIDEGEGEEAGNLDGLDITGTHYVALQAAMEDNDLTRDMLGF
jgi:hypothetical protein